MIHYSVKFSRNLTDEKFSFKHLKKYTYENKCCAPLLVIMRRSLDCVLVKLKSYRMIFIAQFFGNINDITRIISMIIIFYSQNCFILLTNFFLLFCYRYITSSKGLSSTMDGPEKIAYYMKLKREKRNALSKVYYRKNKE